MRTELVNTLVKAGVVTEAQVDRAELYNFGSSLVERLLCLGYGSEEDVFKIIKNSLKLTVIEGNELDNIPEEVLNAVPRDLIEKHHFLPFYADNAKIHIAFFDPTKDSCFSEVSFFTSKIIVPFGVRANVLAKSLNKRFNLKLPEEFKYGKEQISNPSLTPPPLMDDGPVVAKPKMPPIPTSIPKPPIPTVEKKEPPVNAELQKVLEKQTEEIAKLMSKVSELGKDKVAPQPQPEPTPQPQPQMPESAASQPQPQVKIEELKIEEPKVETKAPAATLDTSSFGDDDDSIVDFKDVGCVVDIEQAVAPVVKKEAPVSTPVEKPAAPAAPVEQSAFVDTSAIDAAKDKNSAIDAVNVELKKITKGRSMILFVKYDDLVTADGSELKVSLQAPSFFKDVHDSGKRFYGIPPKSYVSDELFNKLGGDVPALVCAVPVSIDNEVFAILYAEGVDNPMEAEEIAEKMAVVFDRLLSQ